MRWLGYRQRNVAVEGVSIHLPCAVDMSRNLNVFTLVDSCPAGIGDGVDPNFVTDITLRVYLGVLYLDC